MASLYTVGATLDGETEQFQVEASDALVAALKVKYESPKAHINYVRKTNARGDSRHPHDAIEQG